MATLREPKLRGMSVEPRPMANAERAQFGLPQQIDDQVRADTKRMVDARRAAPTSAGPAVAPTLPATPAAPASRLRGAANAVGGAAKSLTAGLGKLGGAAAGISGAVDGIQTPTEDYRQRFNLQTDDPSLAGDLGVRALGVGSDVLNAATFGMLTPAFADKRSPAAAAATEAAPNTPAGLPSGPTAGPARSPGTSLAQTGPGAPGASGGGSITRSVDASGRTTYSGTDVGANATIVDGSGKAVEPRGGMATFSGPLFGGGLRQSAAPATAPQAPQRQSFMDEVNNNIAGLRKQGAVVSGSTLRGLIGASQDRYNAEIGNDTSRANTFDNNVTSRANNEASNETSRYGTDAQVGERRDARVAEQAAATRLRGVQASIFKAAGGDAAKASQIALENGYGDLAKGFSGAADSQDGRATARSKAVDEFLKPLAINAEGKVDEGMLATTRGQLEAMAKTQGVSVDELMQDRTFSLDALKTLSSLNATRNNGVGQMIGLDSPTPQLDQLPSLRGPQSRVGPIDGLMTPNVSWGDTRIDTPNGPQYIRQQDITDGTRRVLRNQGAVERPNR